LQRRLRVLKRTSAASAFKRFGLPCKKNGTLSFEIRPSDWPGCSIEAAEDKANVIVI
jgi:hypothetical protein